jgi:autotransporter-associated beta strand protein
MTATSTLSRRRFLRNSGGVGAALIAAPAIDALIAASRAAAATGSADGGVSGSALTPFVDHYTTNVSADLTAANNAAVVILSGMAQLWSTGAAWNTGTVLDRGVLRANLRHCAKVTGDRTNDQAKAAFIHDRQDQSYGMIDGLGPLAPLYKAGALAVTSITSAPDGTPATTINDVVPPGSPVGSATGAGSATSALGAVVTLVQTLRGNFSSGNPSKASYLYPRPWRMNEESEVADTGAVDAYGFPVYESDVIVAPQLLLQRSATPATDGGFPSGHTNAFFLAGLAYAYAVPERFQELVARAFELADSRIVAGMHSPVDVLGGRILATALAAAILNDPANAAVKAAARAQALAYFEAQTNTTADTLYGYAHSLPVSADPYADRAANAAAVEPFFTYDLPRRSHGAPREMTVPKGAEVLLETRLPYLDAAARREVLRTTALPSGHPLLDGPELWGRLNLFAAADGYGSFAQDVLVAMDAAAGGFSAADAWRNDIDGHGGLTVTGSGTLTLTGQNSYTGDTRVQAGTLVAGSASALGKGDVQVGGGTLRLAADDTVLIRGGYVQSGGTLELTADSRIGEALQVKSSARLSGASALIVHVDPARPPRDGDEVRVLEAHSLHGVFGSVSVDAAGYRAEPRYTSSGLSVRIFAH